MTKNIERNGLFGGSTMDKCPKCGGDKIPPGEFKVCVAQKIKDAGFKTFSVKESMFPGLKCTVVGVVSDGDPVVMRDRLASFIASWYRGPFRIDLKSFFPGAKIRKDPLESREYLYACFTRPTERPRRDHGILGHSEGES